MYKLGFIGMGNMASAILLGGLNSGYIKHEDVVKPTDVKIPFETNDLN